MSSPTTSDLLRLQREHQFLGALLQSHSLATARAGTLRRFISVAGRTVELQFAGQALVRHVMPPFEHLETSPPTSERAALTIRLWDTASTKVRPPRPPWDVDDDAARGPTRADPAIGLRTWFSACSATLLCRAASSRAAFCWVRDPALIPSGEAAAPLRAIWAWWGADIQGLMVHGAAVGTRGGGVLLVGRGGSGKSTTALRCLEAGWQYAGDDSLLLRDLGERFQACSLYSSARVDIHRLSGAFRSLRQHTEVQPGDADHKVMLLLETTHRAQIAPELPIDAVIVARVSRRGETSLRKAQAGEVLTALLPSSLFLTPGAGQKAVDGLGRLVRRVPAYVLELGSEPAHIVTAMDQVLQKHARPTRCEPSVS